MRIFIVCIYSFFQAAIVSILLYGCTTWTLTKRLEKKLDGNYTRMMRAILNRSRSQHPTKQHLYGHLPSITKTIKIRRSRYAGHCNRSRDKLKSDVILWTPSHRRAKAGWPAETYIKQLFEVTECSPEDLPEAMNGRETWHERLRDIPADETIRWDDDDDGIYIYIYIYIYKYFNPVNPEKGIIPIRTNKIFNNRISNSNNPDKKGQCK